MIKQTNNTIKNCNLKSEYTDIYLTYSDYTIILNNDIYGNVAGNTNYYQTGIYLYTGTTNTKIQRNKIHDFYYTGSLGYANFGIYYYSEATTVTEISNNVIYNILADGEESATYSNYAPAGIYIRTGGNIQIYYNSIYLSSAAMLGKSYNSCSSGLQVDASITLLDVRNNAFRNSMLDYGSTLYTDNLYSIRSKSAASAFTYLDFNDHYVTTSANTNPYIGYIALTPYSTLSAWRTATNKDINSVSADPGFTSTTDLTPKSSDLNCWNIKGGAYPLTNVTTDYTGISARRTAVTDGPEDIGAYKFTPDVGVEPNAVVITGVIADGGTSTLKFAGSTIATITWHIGTGTFPSISAVFKPGTLPPGTLTGTTYSYEHLDITATGGTAGYNYDLTLYYNLARTYNINLADFGGEDNLRVAKYSTLTSTWTALLANTTTTSSTRTVAVTGISDGFSSFTFTGNNAPLPVVLSSFTSNVNGRDVKLTWVTASEQNNAGFEIQRAEVGSQNLVFSKIGYVNGKGTVNTSTNYTFEDKKLQTGK